MSELTNWFVATLVATCECIRLVRTSTPAFAETGFLEYSPPFRLNLRGRTKLIGWELRMCSTVTVRFPVALTMANVRYLLATSTFTPLYGRLCNVLGRRNANQTAVYFAALGTAACGFSGNMESLIAARFVSADEETLRSA